MDLDKEFQALLEASRPRTIAPCARGPAPLVFARGFVPACLTFAALGWWQRGAVEAAIFGLLRTGPVTVLLLGWLALVSLAERLYPANPAWNYRLRTTGAAGWSRLGRDLFYLVYVTFGTAALVGFAAARLPQLVPHAALALWPSAAPLAVRIALAFLLVELFSYALHRAAHHVPLLWQFHSTHHVITELGGLKAIRTHPVENVLFHLVRTVPLVLVGAGAEELVAATYLGSFLGVLAHANLELAPGWLGLVVNFPAYHAVHHSAALDESRSNYGCHTVLWDRVFGTFRASPAAPLVVGVHPVGTRSLWQELVWPFYRPVTPRAVDAAKGD